LLACGDNSKDFKLSFIDRPKTVPVCSKAANSDERIRCNEIESGTLIATRDLLLPKLMSGEILVKDTEKIAEVVL
jgi:hypothetical protein